MSDKLQITREYILSGIENGELAEGEKLPAARELAEAVGVSLPIAQMAFMSLTRDGILSSIPRQGTYVRHDWRDRILPGSFRAFRPIWEDIIRDTVAKEFPDIRICRRFSEGIFEIRFTMDAQNRQEHYLDLNDLFHEACPNQDEFFLAPFQGFRTPGGKLFGIPLTFSPWVIAYNPEIIQEAGGDQPSTGWSWEDFIHLVRVLRRSYEGHEIINFLPYPSFWMNFIFRAGGSVIAKSADGFQVNLDSPQTLEGLNKVKELYRELGSPRETCDFVKKFFHGELAMLVTTREDIDFNSEMCWKCISLPFMPGGADLVAQATDLLCVQRLANNLDQVRGLIRLLLSEEVQEKLGRARYGIPIRKTSAIRTFSEEDPRDKLFCSEMTKISARYNFGSYELSRLIVSGLNRIWYEDANIAGTAKEIAAALRTILRYHAID